MATAVATPPVGFAALSRAVVAAANEFVGTVERAVSGERRVRTARDNAWDAICADRARARARDEMDAMVRALLADSPRSQRSSRSPRSQSSQRETPEAARPQRRRPANTRRQLTASAAHR